MRIDLNTSIGVLPISEVRNLMRQLVERRLGTPAIAEILRMDEQETGRFLGELQFQGLVVQDSRGWTATMQGSALACARANRPLTRRTADRLLAGLVERAAWINEGCEFAYRVAALAVFGSYLAGKERPSDLDVGCILEARWGDCPFQAKHEDARRDSRRARPENVSEWAAWPQIEVLRYLRGRSTGISLHQVRDFSQLPGEYRMVLRGESA